MPLLRALAGAALIVSICASVVACGGPSDEERRRTAVERHEARTALTTALAALDGAPQVALSYGDDQRGTTQIHLDRRSRRWETVMSDVGVITGKVRFRRVGGTTYLSGDDEFWGSVIPDGRAFTSDAASRAWYAGTRRNGLDGVATLATDPRDVLDAVEDLDDAELVGRKRVDGRTVLTLETSGAEVGVDLEDRRLVSLVTPEEGEVQVTYPRRGVDRPHVVGDFLDSVD